MRHIRSILIGLVALVTFALAAPEASAHPRRAPATARAKIVVTPVGVEVVVVPAHAKVVVVKGERRVWVPGHRRWNPRTHSYVWVKGHYVRVR